MSKTKEYYQDIFDQQPYDQDPSDEVLKMHMVCTKSPIDEVIDWSLLSEFLTDFTSPLQRRA